MKTNTLLILFLFCTEVTLFFIFPFLWIGFHFAVGPLIGLFTIILCIKNIVQNLIYKIYSVKEFLTNIAYIVAISLYLYFWVYKQEYVMAIGDYACSLGDCAGR